jgi:hypothetical protein
VNTSADTRALLVISLQGQSTRPRIKRVVLGLIKISILEAKAILPAVQHVCHK